MFEKIVQLRGKKTGSTSIILAGVHGDERCGVEALTALLPTLTIAAGRVLFGYGNPFAIQANRRFMEADLNRMFQSNAALIEAQIASSEYRRAQFLKPVLQQADALLDLHASFTPQSTPFVICEANAAGIAEFLPPERIVSGFDRVEPGGTDNYMNQLGKIGICVECGFLGDPESTRVAKESVLAFLDARGHFGGERIPRQTRKSYVHMTELYRTTTDHFTLSRPFEDFEKLRKGEHIGRDGAKAIRAKSAGVILFARNRNQAGSEGFLFGETKNSLA
ncbi:MAG: succinylglutamate desuccinylase/aspartoacylase family protein [Patescibacteria group bacterium]